MTSVDKNKREAALANAAQRALQSGDAQRAVSFCNDLTSEFKMSPDAWRFASQTGMRLGNHVYSLSAINNALSLDASDPGDWLQKLECEIRLQRIEEAGHTAQYCARLKLDSGLQYGRLAHAFQQMEQHQQAIKFYELAIALEPKNTQHRFNLATIYRYLGNKEKASAAFGDVLRLNPQDAQAHYLRSGLYKATPNKNHIAELKNYLQRATIAKPSDVPVYFALAKELEDLEDYDDSFKLLLQGASLRRQHMKYSLDADLSTLAKIQQVIDNDLMVASRDHCSSKAPIFVVGMPRTGTTLVERILGAHSQVFAAGELTNFSSEMTRQIVTGLGSRRPSKEELVARSASLDFAKLGQAYVDSTKSIIQNTTHFVDKLPFNYLYIGLIHLALPNAKIIHVKRDPMDTCYAVFKTLFNTAYPFSYKLEELGRYYLAYRQLMNHWEGLLPSRVYHLSYEALVSAPQEQTAALLEHCDLDWEEACLSFYNNPLASTTASASQIREPIYRSSVGKWKHYALQLEPLYFLLKQHGLIYVDN